MILRIDHVQLAMPAGGEDAARAFYGGLLGMEEVEKPEALARRGGAWFRAGEAQVHLGVEPEFRPARKAHPALAVRSLAELAARLRNAGVDVVEDGELPGYDRVYVSDPFGNRLELLESKMPQLKEIAVEFLTLVASGKVREAYERHVGTGFRHHNPHFKGDAASLREGMEANAAQNPHKSLEVRQALEEGDRVAVLSHVRQRPGDPGAAVVHVFRFDGTRIVELWDVGQAVPKDAVNEHGMF